MERKKSTNLKINTISSESSAPIFRPQNGHSKNAFFFAISGEIWLFRKTICKNFF